jgi:hypothetical protein
LTAISNEVNVYKDLGNTDAAKQASKEAAAVVTALPASGLTDAQKALLGSVTADINKTLDDLGLPPTDGTPGGTGTVTADLNAATTALTNSNISRLKTAAAQLKNDDIISAEALVLANKDVNRSELAKARASAQKVLAAKEATAANITAAKAVLADTTQAANMGTAEFFAENTSTNGIAGNPSSMMNIMVDGQFTQSSDIGNANTVTLGSSSDGGIKRSFSVGVGYNYYNLAGTSVNTINLPLTYSTKFNDRNELILSVPLSYIGQSSKIDSYQIGVGVAYKWKPMNFWTMTPAFNYAYRTASYSNNWLGGALSGVADAYAGVALGDEVSMWGGSISNKWDFNYNGIKIALTNMNGYFENFGGSLGSAAGASGYSNTISSYVLKNGVSFTKDLGGFNASTYLTDTEYFESNLFFEQINEFGFAFKPESLGLGNLNVSVGYLFSLKGGPRGDLDGFKLNLNYQF